jgi:hypothetical protein
LIIFPPSSFSHFRRDNISVCKFLRSNSIFRDGKKKRCSLLPFSARRFVDVDTPRAMKREREESLPLSLSLLLGDSRVFSVVLFSLSRQRQKETTGCEEEELEREARKGKIFERAAPLLSLFFLFFLVVFSRACRVVKKIFFLFFLTLFFFFFCVFSA